MKNIIFLKFILITLFFNAPNLFSAAAEKSAEQAISFSDFLGFINLKSSDGKIFKVPIEIAKNSVLIKNALEGKEGKIIYTKEEGPMITLGIEKNILKIILEIMEGKFRKYQFVNENPFTEINKNNLIQILKGLDYLIVNSIIEGKDIIPALRLKFIQILSENYNEKLINDFKANTYFPQNITEEIVDKAIGNAYLLALEKENQ